MPEQDPTLGVAERHGVLAVRLKVETLATLVATSVLRSKVGAYPHLIVFNVVPGPLVEG
jgi:hypothetical protein